MKINSSSKYDIINNTNKLININRKLISLKCNKIILKYIDKSIPDNHYNNIYTTINVSINNKIY
jgi:hypothetical protein